ncbi:hypothetical protein [Candidatus Mycolicibacterium alkanivorans]|uniref:TnsA-like heteromeric transposase endonuclease subunit n=1 Tax=Candidatus Mycolicibacterium alkanivorans TaxID=2954114 RepID=A0ABS9YX98_9MYCO|nr:hypothetical protein [Candidatus Mycolicibacterium alkanivorans]MCI4675853.1 hypothetical protein [Candidatus Mycolicibacterium alkanivorans]
MVWRDGQGKQRRHAPDFLVRRTTGGCTLVLDSRPRESIGDRAAFAAMSQASSMVSWEYALWDCLDPVVAANHRWLGGYRHPRCFDEAVLSRIGLPPRRMLR